MMWKDVVGYEGVYSVSDAGDIKRIKGGQGARPDTIISQSIESSGYYGIHLCMYGKKRFFRIHYLVICAFISPRPSIKHEVRHLDGCKTNNSYKNLSWGTRRENVQDAIKHKTATVGARNGGAKFTTTEIGDILVSLSTGERASSIARRFKVSPSIISDIKLDKSYKEVERN